MFRTLRKSLKPIAPTLRAIAHSNTKTSELLLKAAGALSERAEITIRDALILYPPVIKIKHSPAGLPLSQPIRMLTCEGRDQVSRAIYLGGWAAFEYPLPSLLAGVLISAPEGLFLDIGANTGIYSLLSKSICPKRKIYAFEPFPPILKILKSNIALNTIASDIVFVDAAASDETGGANYLFPRRSTA